jgi:hypothetical protein
VEVAAADDDNSVYRFARVHSSWSLRAIWLTNDALTAGTASRPSAPSSQRLWEVR